MLFTKTLSNSQFAALSIIMVIGRAIDGFNDPIMGNILEITRTRWGKFKPWIFGGMLASAAIYLVSFTSGLDGWAYVVFFGFMYFLYDPVFTTNDIAYWGMIPALAAHKEDRDKLTSQAVLFAGIGGAISQILVPPLTAGKWAIGGNAITAYRVIAILFTLLFLGFQAITLIGVKEKPLPPKGKGTVNNVGLGALYRTIRNNDQLAWAILFFLCQTTGAGIVNAGFGMNYIYFEFGYNGFLFTVFSALGAVAAAAVMLFFTPISKRFTRNQMMRISAWSVAGGYAMILLVGLLIPSAAMVLKFGLLMVGNLFAFAGQSVAYLVIMICIANTVEYNEWKTGIRAEGIIFSIRPFITKLGWSLQSLIVMVAFLASGVREFTNKIAALEQESSRSGGADMSARIRDVLASVPPGKSNALLLCMTILPVIFALAAYFIYKKKYIITEEHYERMLVELDERRGLVEEEVLV